MVLVFRQRAAARLGRGASGAPALVFARRRPLSCRCSPTGTSSRTVFPTPCTRTSRRLRVGTDRVLSAKCIRPFLAPAGGVAMVVVGQVRRRGRLGARPCRRLRGRHDTRPCRWRPTYGVPWSSVRPRPVGSPN
ncbi:hypothetical protein HBB16_08945 [Pseudonocardia sp. MCCB 268]|nr:hypothetical protein [Pseudonocardia cytotoxica]